jgi:para-nitrobenzyl esterase
VADTVTTTTTGRVAGAEIDGGVVYRGIPYAASPVGPARFRPPAAAERWDGVRDCRRFGPACPQMATRGTGGVMHVFDADGPMSEDCLNLNVWTPAPDGDRRPTMVWIHGGGFRSGSGSCPLYSGGAFIRDDVVLVTINYRLHAFGFLYLDDLFDGAESTGNLGVLDQIAALGWVRDNIAAFGGDPENVTVFGESAGAMAIGTMLGMASAKGLFRRAIAESGAAHHTISARAADRVARRTLELLDVRPGEWDALRSVPAPALTRASARVGSEAADLLVGEFSAAMPFQPVVDGRTLTATPISLIADGAAAGVDLVIGTCADELRVVAWGMPEELQRRRLDPAVASVLAGAGLTVEGVAGAYASVRPGTSELDRHLAMETDYRYAVPAVSLAEAQGRHARVWMYRFSWPTPVIGGLLGACHALEVPFVFETHAAAPVLVGDDPPVGLAAAVHDAWVRFARAGDPGAQWPEYDTGRRAVMDFGAKVGVVDDPAPLQRELWRDLVDAWERA